MRLYYQYTLKLILDYAYVCKHCKVDSNAYCIQKQRKTKICINVNINIDRTDNDIQVEFNLIYPSPNLRTAVTEISLFSNT